MVNTFAALCALYLRGGILALLVCCLARADPVGGTEHQPQPNKYDFAETFCAARPVSLTRSKELESAAIEARQVDGAKRPVKAVGTFLEPTPRCIP